LPTRACTIEFMSAARPSLAWKTATANILLVLFAVLMAGMLQYRKEPRILATTMTCLVGAQAGELCYARGGHPGDDLTVLAIIWTPQRSGVAHL